MRKLLQSVSILFLLAGIASAQWPTDPTANLPVCTAAGNQDHLQGMNNAQQGMLLGWLDARTAPTALYAQRITKEGDFVWQTDGKFVASDVNAFSMMPSSEGRTYVAWSQVGVYAQLLDENGDPMWPAPVSLFGGSRMTDGPFVVSYGPLGVVIVAAQVQPTGTNFWAAKLDTNGNILWTSLQTEAGEADNIRVLNDLHGGAFVGYDLDHTDVKLNQVNSGGFWGYGDPRGILVTTSPCAPKYLNWILPSGDGSIYVTWSQRNAGSGCQGPYDDLDIRAQKIDSLARAWGDSGVAVCELPGDQTQSRIMVNSEAKIFVVWTDYGHGDPAATESDIYMQMLGDTLGNAILSPNGVPVCNAPGDQKNPAVLLDGVGGMIVTWQDYRNGTWDIFAQRVDGTGTALWATNGVPISTASGDQTEPTLALVDNGSAICAWVDGRKGSETDIYAQRVYPDGSLPVVFTTLSATVRERSVELSWSVNPLLSYRSFEIWRAEGEDAEFHLLNQVRARTVTTYRFTDDRVQPGSVYRYRVVAVLLDGSRELSRILSTTLSEGQVASSTIPTQTQLIGAYPNPFTAVTRISYQIGAPGDVRLTIFDVAGREVRTFELPSAQKGQKGFFVWDGHDAQGRVLPAGMYLLRLTAPDYTGIRKVVIQR